MLKIQLDIKPGFDSILGLQLNIRFWQGAFKSHRQLKGCKSTKEYGRNVITGLPRYTWVKFLKNYVFRSANSKEPVYEMGHN